MRLSARTVFGALGSASLLAHVNSMAASSSTATQLPSLTAFGSAVTVCVLTLAGGVMLRSRLPVLSSGFGVVTTAFLWLLVWNPSDVSHALQAVVTLALCVIAIEISLSLSATPYRGVLLLSFRTTQIISLALGATILLASRQSLLATVSLACCSTVFMVLAANAFYIGVFKQRFTLFFALAWVAMAFAALKMMALGYVSLSVEPVGPSGLLGSAQQVQYLLTLTIFLLALGLMQKTMRSHSAWAKELAASKQTDRMLRLEQTQREFSREVDDFLGTVLPNDFEEVVLNSFLTHLDRVIDVSASAVVIAHRGQMRVVSRFPQGDDLSFSSVLVTRENLLQSVCLSDKAAVLHSDDNGLRVDNELLSTLCVVPVEAPRNDWAGVVLARTSEHVFNLDEMLLVKSFAEHVRASFVSANKYNRIRRQAETDMLTGLMNRRAITARAERAFKKARSLRRELSILFIDIDNFKAVNDLHGHEAGDQALYSVAQLCEKSLRDEDRVGRFGGEEFIVILPGTGEEHAHLVAERIRESVAQSPLSVDGALLDLTVSIGISELAPRFKTTQDMLNAADRALYAAKRDGRNRVVHHMRIVSSNTDL
ncbi:MAG: GGDEF domain-containing protein [Gammaproteobacteria bacterium]